MDVFKLMRSWFNFCFENPEMIKPNHSALYFFCIEHCNRLGWKKKFGLPTEMAKEAIGIKNYRTYINTLQDLIDWEFIKLIQKSQNQYSANVVAIVENTIPHTNAYTKATQKHIQKHCISTYNITDSIDIPNTILPNTINLVYDSYPSKCPVKKRTTSKSSKDKNKIKKLLQEHTEEKLIKTIEWYVDDCKKTGTYLKNFSTFLNNLPDIDISTKNKKEMPEAFIYDENGLGVKNPEYTKWQKQQA